MKSPRLERATFAFDLASADALHRAIDELMASLDPRLQLLGLGEALHGGEEILILRNRLFEHLVKAHAFTAIAIESSFPSSALVNQYILGRGPRTFDEARDDGFTHGFGSLDANRELVAWLRQYNSGASPRTKLHFYGFDLPGIGYGPCSPKQVLDFTLGYLASIDSAAAAEHRRRFESLLHDETDWQNPMAWHDPDKSPALLAALTSLRVETEDLISVLRARQPELIERSDRAAYTEALHNAFLARQSLNFFAALAHSTDYAASLRVRDVLMADNLEYIIEREGGRGKVLAFAHNGHLQHGQTGIQIGEQFSKWWPAGSHLAHSLGRRYAVIGSAVGVSEANGIGQPGPGTIEAQLTALPGPIRFMPARGIEGIFPGPPRSASAKNPSYLPLSSESLRSFDWLVVFDAVTYSRGAPPLPKPAAGGP